MPDSGQDEEQRNTSHADNGVAASTTGEEGLVVWCVCVRARAVVPFRRPPWRPSRPHKSTIRS